MDNERATYFNNSKSAPLKRLECARKSFTKWVDDERTLRLHMRVVQYSKPFVSQLHQRYVAELVALAPPY